MTKHEKSTFEVNDYKKNPSEEPKVSYDGYLISQIDSEMIWYLLEWYVYTIHPSRVSQNICAVSKYFENYNNTIIWKLAFKKTFFCMMDTK